MMNARNSHEATAGIHRAAFEFYVHAKEHVLAAGFTSEIDWQERTALADLTKPDFLREQAWVVLSSGMRASVVGARFEQFSAAFCSWDAAQICETPRTCIERALRVFAHPAKISAIAANCLMIADADLDSWKAELRTHGPAWLMRLGYIGPVTCWHLAKNIGLDVVKPDRHLVRMARASGARDVNELCCLCSTMAGDSLAVVDLVLWRYATLQPNYVSEARALQLQHLRFRNQPDDARARRAPHDLTASH